VRLSEYTDYTLRVLMYCAARPEQLVTIAEIAEHHRLSRSHLMKIVSDLGRQGLLETLRGRSGGIRLLRDAHDIRVGDVIRAAETDFRLVECFDERSNQCALTGACGMKRLLGAALAAYFRELDGATLADVMAGPAEPPARRGSRVIPIRPGRSRRAAA